MSKCALLSVYDKTGIVEFARELIMLGYDILSSGGTAKTLREHGVTVTDVAEISGLKPILDHRVVTLTPQVHGGLLAKTEDPKHLAELESIGGRIIDLVCVDLYPLEAEIARAGATRESVIEKTDIGGPTMLSSAAKGRRIVVSDAADRNSVLGWLKEGQPDREEYLTLLAAKADAVVARYRLASARYQSSGAVNGMVGTRIQSCKYGENASQTPAGLFSTWTEDPLGLDKFTLVAGTSPSYNNLCDLDRLLLTMTRLAAFAEDVNGTVRVTPDMAIGVKHGNPCGAALGDWERGRQEVLEEMLEGEQRAIFGGLVMTNFAIDEELADILLTHGMKKGRRLLDGIIAPDFTQGAVSQLARKGDKCRFLKNPALAKLNASSIDTATRFRYVRGGFLVQPNYTFRLGTLLNMSGLGEAPADIRSDLGLAWAVGSTSNSNTITLVKNGKLIGNGVGQQDRVSCCQLALKRAEDAGHDVKGAVAYSDSFFPFPDGAEVLCKAGIKAVFTTTGSVNDAKVLSTFMSYGVEVYSLPDTVARGFFGH